MFRSKNCIFLKAINHEIAKISVAIFGTLFRPFYRTRKKRKLNYLRNGAGMVVATNNFEFFPLFISVSLSIDLHACLCCYRIKISNCTCRHIQSKLQPKTEVVSMLKRYQMPCFSSRRSFIQSKNGSIGL